MMPRPDAASSETIRCTSTLAPISMPRVGSSRMRTCGSVASHLAMTTFCWLPPDSAFAAWSTPVIRIRSRSAYPWANVRSTEPRISRLGKSRDRIGSVTLEAIGKSSTSPCW